MVGKILSMLGIAILFSSSLQADSEKLTNPSNGHSYQRFDTTKNWFEASASCSDLDAHLATITSESENNWLIDNLIGQHSVWLGGTDNGTEGNWQWITGEPWDFTYWLQNQPDGENYLQYGIGENAADGWNDWVSDGAIGYVCEWGHITPSVTHCVNNAQELQDALSIASLNHADDEIRVKSGTYVGNFLYVSTQFNNLILIGGYSTECTNINSDSSKTILDGKQSGTVLAASVNGITADLTFKNLTIQNGNRSSGNGGGLYAAVGPRGSVTIDSCTLKDNIAADYGGGVSVWANLGRVNITNSSIIGNTSGSGGGIFISGESGIAILKSNRITQNHAENGTGGGVHINATSGTMDISDNYIVGNSSTHSYMTSYGGGIYFSHGNTSSSSFNFVNNAIIENKTSGIGGGLSIHSDYLYLNESSILLKNNNISGNEASYGGGVSIDAIHSFANNSTINFTNNRIEDNTGAEYGGGVYLGAQNSIHGESSFAFINNNIINNTANSYGGGIYASTSLGNLIFTNNNFVLNTTSMLATSYGGGLYLILGSNEQNSLGRLYNNLFWNNSANNNGKDLWIDNDGNDNFQTTPISFMANNFDRTVGLGYFLTLPIAIDPSNLNKVDPLFVDADNYDLHLQSESPMIDAGYPSTPDLPEFDIGGTPRVLGETVDIGAYEYDDGSDPRGILTVNKAGVGTGTIISNPTGINCGNDCAHAFDLDTDVMLTATPDANTAFTGWSGDADCVDGILTMDAHKHCTATFTSIRQLTVSKTGSGNGTITSSPSGINCGASCTSPFYMGEEILLTATPDAFSTFSDWNPANCKSVFVLNEDRTCTATFDPKIFWLYVFVAGSGTGSVTSDIPGINCGTDCEEDYSANSLVTLTAAPGSYSDFAGWSGACVGTALTCQVTMSKIQGVVAIFNLKNYTVTATASTDGSISPPALIVNHGATTTFTVTPNAGYQIASVTGCGGSLSGSTYTTGPITAACNVSATFTLKTYPLQVTKADTSTGIGTITSNPTGINCGNDCLYAFAHGTNVTLTATPDPASVFNGWSGACSGTNPVCTVSMDAAKTATAEFVINYPLIRGWRYNP